VKRAVPDPGQESVWDYPRPPRLELTGRHVRVEFSGVTIANSTRSYRVLETSHPPAYYIPPDDVRSEFLVAVPHRTFCEFKGQASYWDVRAGERRSANAAWSYASPTREFTAIASYFAFYPSRVDACFVDDEPVQAQEGDFYGGWITSKIVGPFKGAR
jgi:uncharacterized protein (DUF427 family)